jgi:hypothetical protein
MNRRILINEDERSRILGLHENRKHQEWGMLFEEAVTTGSTTTPAPSAGSCASAPGLKSMDDEIKFRDFAKKNYGEETLDYGPKTGVNKIAWSGFVNTPKVFCNPNFQALGRVYNHKPASGGGKTIGELFLAGGVGATTGSAVGTTFYIDGKPQVLGSDKEINDMIAARKITQDTYVYKSPEITPPTLIKDLKDDSPIKKALMGEISKIAPELQQKMSIFTLDAKGQRLGPFDTTALEKQIVTDKTITKDTKVWNGADWVPASQVKELQQFFEKLGPQAPDVNAGFKTSGIPELDAWLKGPLGSVWDKMEEGPLKEKSLDTYTKSDPDLKAIADKIGIGKMRDALGTQRSTMAGRMFAGLRKRGVEALGGKVQDQR